jgi:hypothetical protein
MGWIPGFVEFRNCLVLLFFFKRIKRSGLSASKAHHPCTSGKCLLAKAMARFKK